MAQYGPYDRSLRAADSDRESVAAILREQHVAGRIDDDELQDRIERCYTAKTYADLDAVIADLPHEEPAVTSRGRPAATAAVRIPAAAADRDRRSQPRAPVLARDPVPVLLRPPDAVAGRR